MDLHGVGYLARVNFLIRDRDAKYPALIDSILSSAGISTVLTSVRMPRMNAITEGGSRRSAWCTSAWRSVPRRGGPESGLVEVSIRR
jgi:hypothetical protein